MTFNQDAGGVWMCGLFVGLILGLAWNLMIKRDLYHSESEGKAKTTDALPAVGSEKQEKNEKKNGPDLKIYILVGTSILTCALGGVPLAFLKDVFYYRMLYPYGLLLGFLASFLPGLFEAARKLRVSEEELQAGRTIERVRIDRKRMAWICSVLLAVIAIAEFVGFMTIPGEEQRSIMAADTKLRWYRNCEIAARFIQVKNRTQTDGKSYVGRDRSIVRQLEMLDFSDHASLQKKREEIIRRVVESDNPQTRPVHPADQDTILFPPDLEMLITEMYAKIYSHAISLGIETPDIMPPPF